MAPEKSDSDKPEPFPQGTLDQISEHLTTTWGGKTLADFRGTAEREETGILFEAVRVAGGRRIVLIVCITDIDHIALLERGFEFVDDGCSEDWSTFTLGSLFKRTALGSGFCHESLRDEYGRRSAVVVCSTEPRSIEKLTGFFTLPK